MTDALLEHGAALYARLWPALLGAVVALYFHPAESTRIDQVFAFAASVGTSVLFAPAFIAYFEVETDALVRAVHGAVALFGLTAVGQVIAGLRELRLAAMLGEALRRRFGLGGRGDG